MQCVILAGGIATRMRPYTNDTPKWLLPVRGRPFAHWQLTWLAGHGVDHVVCCIGHLGQQIVDTIGDGAAFGVRIDYSEDGPQLMGTGGALALAADRDLLADRFLVVYGDSYLPVDVGEVWRAYLADARPALMTVFRNEGSFDASNAAYADGQVLRYTKGASTAGATAEPGSAAPSLDYIDYGLSGFERRLFTELDRSVPVDLAVLQEALAARGELAGFEVTERFYEVGSPQGLADLERHLAERGAEPG